LISLSSLSFLWGETPPALLGLRTHRAAWRHQAAADWPVVCGENRVSIFFELAI
jgi:hypothetical protein